MTSDPSDNESFFPTKIPGERPGQEGGRRHANRLARTRALCESALDRFLELGLDAVTIDDVVQAAGTSKGTFYRYFTGKEDLISAVFRPISGAVLGAMERCIEALKEAEDAAALEDAYAALATELLGVLLEQPAPARLFLQERHGPATPARLPIVELDEAVVERAVGMTEAGRTRGLLQPVDPRVTALTVVGAIHELLWQQFQGRGTDDPLRSAGELIDIILHGVRAR